MNSHHHSRRILLLWLWLVSTTTTFAFSAIANSNDPQSSLSPSSSSNSKPPKVIPITILSGFLGSGKTTLLQNLLQNKQGLKVAVVVNDVASVNIDSKLVQQQQQQQLQQQQQNFGDTSTDDATILELQNGCACCSQSDELLSTIGTLVTLSDLRKPDQQFQHIVVELSGVADPKLVRAKFQEAQYLQMTLLERVQLDTLVTLIDASAFESRFESTAIASRQETPELYFANGKESSAAPPPSEEDSDNTTDQPELEDWMKELPPQLLQAVMGGNGQGENNADEGSGVADLLVSQTETADVLVLNKCDLVSDDRRIELQQVIAALNPRATVLQTSFGKLAVQQILGVAKGQGASMSGDVDDHRDAVLAAQATTVDLTKKDNDDEDGGQQDSHSHNEEHAAASSSSTHSSHSHDHDHDENCTDATCTDPSHSHSHNHDHHSHDDDCSDPTCAHPSHDHTTHDHTTTTTTAEESSCNDPNCNDPSHSHSHSHDHHDDTNDSQETHAGIGSFVYRARRPFHPTRLTAFLQHLPVVRGVPSKQEEEEEEETGAATTTSLEISADTQQMLQSCLRSKGFCWIANSHASATYWSHAGTSFELSCLGQWWATLPRELWPEGVEEYVLADFDDVHHTDDDDDTTDNTDNTVGDRRQELVFIGNQYANANCQAEITKALNQCLLGDEEYQQYQDLLQQNSGSDEDKESALRAAFSSPLEAKIMSF